MIFLAAIALGQTCDEPKSAEMSGATAESSGVAASRTRDGVYFTHGDKGEGASIYAFRADGTLIETHFVKNADNEDWEDLAAAPCPDVGDCLYIGDIGDNDKDRGQITIYAVEEPKEGKDAKVVAQWTAVYPEGPQDAEALLVHPCTGDIIIVTKAEGSAQIYSMPISTEEVATLKKEVTIGVEGLVDGTREITGGDWDLDGQRVVLRTSNRLLIWNTDPADPHAHWLNAPDLELGADQVQGEAVAFSPDGDVLATSEGTPTSIALYACDATGEPACEFPQTGKKCGCSQSNGFSGFWLLGALFYRKRRVFVPNGLGPL